MVRPARSLPAGGLMAPRRPQRPTMPASFEAELDTVDLAYDAHRSVGRLTLNRPDRLNAIDPQLSRDIVAGLERLEAVNEEGEGVALRGVVIEGAGDRAFCAGADVATFDERTLAAESARRRGPFVMDFPAPVVAKIHGYCVGGGLELAMACDFRVAAADATLGLPESDLGLMPGSGGVQLLARLANPAVAKAVAMKGRRGFLTGEEAADCGLVEEVHPADELDAAVAELTDVIADQPPLAVQAIKRSADVAVNASLEQGLAYDRRQFETLLDTEDAEKGMRAFLEDGDEPEFAGT